VVEHIPGDHLDKPDGGQDQDGPYQGDGFHAVEKSEQSLHGGLLKKMRLKPGFSRRFRCYC
jgi:hypothetical protein